MHHFGMSSYVEVSSFGTFEIFAGNSAPYTHTHRHARHPPTGIQAHMENVLGSAQRFQRRWNVRYQDSCPDKVAARRWPLRSVEIAVWGND